MTLTPELIDELAEYHGLDFAVYEPFARAIEAEVRKDDEALIRQLVEALRIDRIETEDWPADSRIAIDALRARLERPCA